MKLKIYPYGDGYVIVGNDFNCPSCKKRASTGFSFPMDEWLESDDEIEIECSKCGVGFRLKEFPDIKDSSTWEWEEIDNETT